MAETGAPGETLAALSPVLPGPLLRHQLRRRGCAVLDAMLLVAVIVVDAVRDTVLASTTHSANDASVPNSLRLDAAKLALNGVSHRKFAQRRLRAGGSLVFERGLACVRQAVKGGLLCAFARAGALERRHSFDLGG